MNNRSFSSKYVRNNMNDNFKIKKTTLRELTSLELNGVAGAGKEDKSITTTTTTISRTVTSVVCNPTLTTTLTTSDIQK